jgi:hypothetical protein
MYTSKLSVSWQKQKINYCIILFLILFFEVGWFFRDLKKMQLISTLYESYDFGIQKSRVAIDIPTKTDTVHSIATLRLTFAVLSVTLAKKVILLPMNWKDIHACKIIKDNFESVVTYLKVLSYINPLKIMGRQFPQRIQHRILPEWKPVTLALIQTTRYRDREILLLTINKQYLYEKC